MPREVDWEIPGEIQPKPGECSFDLDRALGAVLGVRATVPEDAFTAGTLGTERAGSGVLIRGDGLVLTIGYLVTEAETIWLTTAGGGAVPGHVLAYDQETGFGLVQALGRLSVEPLELGIGMRVGAGDGRLIGIGSLHVQQSSGRELRRDVNMVVPIDLLPPILEDMLTYGRPNRPVRPWLGLYAAEVEDAIVVAGLHERGPASEAGLQPGDRILAVGSEQVGSLAGFWRRVWAGGPAGSQIPLQVARDGQTLTGIRRRCARCGRRPSRGRNRT
jgi:S1-C subfamily serine protease